MDPVFAISDLHLADRGLRDNFAVGDREKRFLQFLDYVDRNQGILLVLGDLFDWWEVNLSQSILAYRTLLERLACVGHNGARWIVGNHDSPRLPLSARNMGCKVCLLCQLRLRNNNWRPKGRLPSRA